MGLIFCLIFCQSTLPVSFSVVTDDPEILVIFEISLIDVFLLS